jgi:hypothetical protein
METNELIKRKKLLESDLSWMIGRLLMDFRNETGVSVSQLSGAFVPSKNTNGDRKHYIFTGAIVEISIE